MTDIIVVSFFWVTFYIFKCMHDGYIAMELREAVSFKNVQNKKKYNMLWHTYGTIEKAIIHLTFSLLFTLVMNETLWYFTLLTLYGVGIRLFIYDGIINLVRGMSWNAYSTCDYKEDWWDCFLVKMRDAGISQQIIKAILLAFMAIPFIMYVIN